MLRGARALIEAIVDRPDEDAPRLLYADHVRDRDAPRAELIAVQCALPRATVESERTALRRREFALLQEHKARWLAEVGLQMGEGQFLRGFVEEIELLVERLGVATGDLVQLAPVRQVRILETRIGRISPVADLAGAPLLRRAESLELRDCRLEADGVRRLFGGAFDRLRRLSLRRAKLDAAGVQALFEGEALASVTTLDLAGNELRNAGAESLAQSTRLASLERLDLTRNNVADAGASALAGTDALPRLEVLRLPTNTIHEEGALALARSSALAALTLLDVHDNFVGKRGALALDAAFGPRCRLREQPTLVSTRTATMRVRSATDGSAYPASQPSRSMVQMAVPASSGVQTYREQALYLQERPAFLHDVSTSGGTTGHPSGPTTPLQSTSTRTHCFGFSKGHAQTYRSPPPPFRQAS